jgi:hypothetical protein
MRGKHISHRGGAFRVLQLALFGSALIWAEAAVSALEPGQVNGAAIGMSYGEARARLLEAGYDGGISPARQYCQAPHAICKAYPREIESCARTGAMPCRFVFRYPRGRTVIVVTKGADFTLAAIFEE